MDSLSKIDITNLSPDLKQLILDHSIQKLQKYDPVHVQTRSDSRYSEFTTRDFYNLFKKRLQDVHEKGFLSDAKEVYKPLHDPQLNPVQLLFHSLQLDQSLLPSKQQKSKQQVQSGNHPSKQKKSRRVVASKPVTGYKHISHKLKQSNTRLATVKFGTSSFEESAAHQELVSEDEEPVHDLTSDAINWQTAKIDEERKLYYMGHYNKFVEAQKLRLNGGKPTDSQTLQHPEKNNTPGYRKLRLPAKQKYSVEFMEEKLHIPPKPTSSSQANSHAPTDSFYTARDDFYDLRNRLTYRLLEDLKRLDSTRVKSYNMKQKVFQVSKKGRAEDDLDEMRSKSSEERKRLRKEILDKHEWYNELINKVVVLNGVQRSITPHEMVILEHIKKYKRLTKVRFTKSTFLDMVRLLPTKEFLKDEVQRIIRFVKSHETISERDYLEVVELAGHGIA